MWLIVNPVPTDLTILCVVTRTAVLVIQRGKTALDKVRERKDEVLDDYKSKYDKVIHYLESVGK